MPPIPKCTVRHALVVNAVTPGTTIHLAGATHCRAFVVTSGLAVDPVTGHEVWQVMEIGDDVIVDGAEPPFTGVVMTVNADNARQWHVAS